MNIVRQQSATSKTAKSNFEDGKKMAKVGDLLALKQSTSTSKSNGNNILRKQNQVMYKQHS